MRVPFRAPAIALALVFAGCVSATSPDQTPAPRPNAFGEAVATRPPATDLVIFVDLDGGTLRTIPDDAYVESPNQDIRWYTNAVDLRIEFKGGTVAPPGCTKGKGRCAMRLPGKAKGARFAYDVIVTDANGKEYRLDPRLIIDY